MADWFVCTNPDHPDQKHSRYYDSMTADGFCPDCSYPGGLLVKSPLPPPAEHGDAATTTPHKQLLGQSIGVCCLVCDASSSMLQRPFTDNPLRKIDLVTHSAARGIADLYAISEPDNAYVAIVIFAGNATLLKDPSGGAFFLSVADIEKLFPTAKALAEYLNDELQPDENVDSSYTNIMAGLNLAREIHEGASRGDLSKFGLTGSFRLLGHTLRRAPDNHEMVVPNTRTLLYSDGEHNAPGVQLTNPWSSDAVSTLMTVSIGEASRNGMDQMQSLACTCPLHALPGFFLINSGERYQTLRYLFRMATGTSGFCPKCLQSERKGLG